ncbi:MAG TPA: hypothetical protein DCM45_07075 [Clostridiales bacterium]|nr:hypothetical protein [Clostridiales bacterium]
MESDKPCIRMTDISVEHSGATVCENLSLTIDVGSLVLLTGRNPACWSVVMRMIGGLQPIPTGVIELWGIPVQRISRRVLSSQVCFVPRQQHPLFAYPVIDYVLQGIEPNLKPLQAPAETDRERARDILNGLHIEKLMYRDSSLLSNRERQLVVVARALMQDAHLLMIDEPFDSLNEQDVSIVLAIFKSLAHSHDKTVIMAMLETGPALAAADRLVTFEYMGIIDKRLP